MNTFHGVEPDGIDEMLAASIASEGSMHTFTQVDHDAKVDRLDDLHLRHMAEAKGRIKSAESDLRSALEAIDRDIADLQRKRADTEAGARRKVEAERRIISKCRAFLVGGA